MGTSRTRGLPRVYEPIGRIDLRKMYIFFLFLSFRRADGGSWFAFKPGLVSGGPRREGLMEFHRSGLRAQAALDAMLAATGNPPDGARDLRQRPEKAVPVATDVGMEARTPHSNKTKPAVSEAVYSEDRPVRIYFGTLPPARSFRCPALRRKKDNAPAAQETEGKRASQKSKGQKSKSQKFFGSARGVLCPRLGGPAKNPGSGWHSICSQPALFDL